MLFDDRLATVLRHRAEGELAARTQYRQLLDLLGEANGLADESLVAAAFLRMRALERLIPIRQLGRLVGDAALRIRNPELLERLAESEPAAAAAALAAARLSEGQWVALIPRLPIRARGFLRHRRDLPPGVVALLDRLGVQDPALPEPDPLELQDEVAPDPVVEASPPLPESSAKTAKASDSIGALVERIQAYTRSRESRETTSADPRLPLGESDPPSARRPMQAFVAGIDTRGRIELADGDVAPMVVGIDLLANSGTIAPRGALAAGFYSRRPVRAAPIELSGSPLIAGEWLIDATPRFDKINGHFLGYAARLRRATPASEIEQAESAADRIRQLLHELRTPVNAIQGFAEVIQQQLFGTTPHEYRALAATIAGDAARMLAGFDELDRLARLESGALGLEPGRSDFVAIARQQMEQLQPVLSARVARFEPSWPEGAASLPITDDEGQMLAWRILATIASATGAGENLGIDFTVADERLAMRCDLPATLAASSDIFSTETRTVGGAVSAGIFGAGFALRLARAEARAAGGSLERRADSLVLTLPLLTTISAQPSAGRVPGRAQS